MKGKAGKFLTAAAVAAAAGVVLKRMRDQQKEQEASRIRSIEEAVMNNRDYGDRQAYLIGGGLASMAAAAYLIRDCKFPGSHITIYESSDVLGGSNDGGGDSGKGFVCRGNHMLNEETCENFWELFSSIPSLTSPNRSVAEEILNFDHAHPTHARARLVNRDGKILDVSSMGFHSQDRLALLKLLLTDEKRLDNLTIQDWFKDTPHFFTTNFWYMWQTTFAFQKWSSAAEFRRSLNRMMFEFGRIETLEGVTSTPLNLYDSAIRPLEEYLRQAGVHFEKNCRVTDLDFAPGPGLTVKALYLKRDNGEQAEGEARYIHDIRQMKDGDICIMTAGSMTDGALLGDLYTAVPGKEEPFISAQLWSKAAARHLELGNPERFFSKCHETAWMSFTVTCRGDQMLKAIENFTGNIPGSGGLMTFKDSAWLLSSTVPAQPYFAAQPKDETCFWGYGLYIQAEGDYVKKPMRDCTGQEILMEYLRHLHISEEEIAQLMETVVNVITCYMPAVNAPFEPHRCTDRPQVVPAGSKNFAMASQFVELPKELVFTEEYSVRAARTAVYTLMGVNTPICPVTPYNRRLKVIFRALKKAMT
ncbi:MAG TPA: oleate hydratase [Candidatus Enterocloster faecavium]|uniref:Oleate hydratase n=1 Tax=Candidatus Enterocloster faecavium TaxID=2838560 RepID=A0A9D2L5G4_9FIRM|nr:oleate hydratase [Candidatus Enterocloster faecavium]